VFRVFSSTEWVWKGHKDCEKIARKHGLRLRPMTVCAVKFGKAEAQPLYLSFGRRGASKWPPSKAATSVHSVPTIDTMELATPMVHTFERLVQTVMVVEATRSSRDQLSHASLRVMTLKQRKSQPAGTAQRMQDRQAASRHIALNNTFLIFIRWGNRAEWLLVVHLILEL
jgi:hypothetical protein